MRKATLPLLLSAILFAGCDLLGLEDPASFAARKEAEGRAIGNACRLSARSLEQCYTLNKRQSKAAIANGWRDMDAYMRENNVAAIPPPPPPMMQMPMAADEEGATGGDDAADEATMRPAGGGEAAARRLPAAGGGGTRT